MFVVGRIYVLALKSIKWWSKNTLGVLLFLNPTLTKLHMPFEVFTTNPLSSNLKQNEVFSRRLRIRQSILEVSLTVLESKDVLLFALGGYLTSMQLIGCLFINFGYFLRQSCITGSVLRQTVTNDDDLPSFDIVK